MLNWTYWHRLVDLRQTVVFYPYIHTFCDVFTFSLWPADQDTSPWEHDRYPSLDEFYAGVPSLAQTSLRFINTSLFFCLGLYFSFIKAMISDDQVTLHPTCPFIRESIKEISTAFLHVFVEYTCIIISLKTPFLFFQKHMILSIL